MFPDLHILVCQNHRAPGHPKGDCCARGAGAVLEALRQEARVHAAHILVSTTGCLKTCAQGPTVVVHPLNLWYGGVTPEDVPDLIVASLAGRALERLLLPPEAAEAFPWGARGNNSLG